MWFVIKVLHVYIFGTRLSYLESYLEFCLHNFFLQTFVMYVSFIHLHFCHKIFRLSTLTTKFYTFTSCIKLLNFYLNHKTFEPFQISHKNFFTSSSNPNTFHFSLWSQCILIHNKPIPTKLLLCARGNAPV